MPEFTRDWSLTRTHWPDLFAPYAEAKDALEIGCFEGGSTLDLLDLMPEAHLVVIDPFSFAGQWERYRANLEPYERRLSTFPVPSGHKDGLRNLFGHESEFDVIYVDGSHYTANVLEDAVLSWPLLRSGGMMLFDDYYWPNHPTGQDVGKAVDAFASCYGLRVVRVGADQAAIYRP